MSKDKSIDKQITDWHSLSVDEAIKLLHSDRHHGLSSQEARQRVKRCGRNRLPPPRKRSALLRFLLQFHNVLIYVMLVAAGTTALLSDWADTGVLLAAILVNAIIGFI